MALAGDNTRIIPGHGPMSTRAELVAYRDMLIAARPTAALDGEWGDGFLDPERFVRIVYTSLAK